MADGCLPPAGAAAETPGQAGPEGALPVGAAGATPQKVLPFKRLPTAPEQPEEWRPEIRCMSHRGKGGDRLTQEWTALHNYLPQALWEQAKRGVREEARLQEFTDFGAELGLRHPSEWTTHRLVVCYLLANRDQPSVRGLGPEHKASLAHVVRESFKALCKREGKVECLVSLPADPAELERWPETKGMLEGLRAGAPVPSPFRGVEVQAMSNSFPVRLARKCAGSPSPTDGAAQAAMAIIQRVFQGAQAPGGLPGLQILQGPCAAGPPGGAPCAPWGAPPVPARRGPRPLALPAPAAEGGGEAPEHGAEAEGTPGQAPGEAGERGADAPAAGAGGGAGAAADAAAGPTKTPDEAAGAMLGALKKRPAGYRAGNADGGDEGEAGELAPGGKRPRRPSCPAQGQKVAFLGATIRRKDTCFFLRIPKELTGGSREWTVERRFRGDVDSAWEKCLRTLEEKLG